MRSPRETMTWNSGVMSFKARLLQLSLWIFLAIALVAVASLYVVYRFQKKEAHARAESYLTRNMESQVNRLIPTFLLEEQWAGTKLILDSIQKEEQLSSIRLLPNIKALPQNFSQCVFDPGISHCLVYNEDEIGVLLPVRESGMQFGYLLKCKHRSEVLSAGQFLYLTYAIFVVLGVAIFALSFAVMRYLNKEAKSFVTSITRWLNRVLAGEGDKLERPVFGIREANDLAGQISDLIREHEESRRKAIVADIARQVAHDIRSPLAALEMSLQDLKGLPEERRLLIKSACEEIGDIVNVLRESKGLDSPSAKISHDQVRVELLSPILCTLISEKRMQYKNVEGVTIDLDLDAANWGIFAKVHRTDFKRVLSNLINNAIEAYEEPKGRVLVKFGIKDKHVLVEVIDKGRGIPQERIGEVLKQGVSYEKSSGTGLGLYHAQQCVQAWSGRLSIDSQRGLGTSVKVELPRVPSPNWFAPEILLNKSKKIVVLDDDPSIHLIWKSRLKNLLDEGLIESVFHFHTGAALEEWWRGVPGEFASEILFLFDYELIDENMNGLDLIKKIGLFNQCILVTSHYDEEPLQRECMKLGARLISKSMAGFIPLKSLEKGEVSRFVLIDDSKVTRLSWKSRAKQRDLSFQDFSSVEEFLKAKEELPKEACIYIDSDLGAEERGEDFARRLFEEGYTNLYLATGHSAKSFEDLPFLKGVVGKDPPWF